MQVRKLPTCSSPLTALTSGLLVSEAVMVSRSVSEAVMVSRSLSEAMMVSRSASLTRCLLFVASNH